MHVPKIILYANGVATGEEPNLPGQIADGKSDDSTITMACPGIQDLISALHYIRTSCNSGDIRDMKLVAHGTSGSLYLGAERLDANGLFRLKNQLFEEILGEGAEIEIVGCNVASGPWGELFMAEFAPIFLRRSGGTVIGHTEDVMAPWGWLGGLTFDFGINVKANVSPGGGVILRGNNYLDLVAVRSRIRQLEARIDGVNIQMNNRLIIMVQGKMDKARTALGPDGSTPTFWNLYNACIALQDVVELVAPLEEAKDSKEDTWWGGNEWMKTL